MPIAISKLFLKKKQLKTFSGIGSITAKDDGEFEKQYDQNSLIILQNDQFIGNIF